MNGWNESNASPTQPGIASLVRRLWHAFRALGALPWLAIASSPSPPSLEALRALISTLPGAIFLMNADAHLVAWTPAVPTLLNASPDALATMPLFTFFAPKYHANIRRAMQHARTKGEIETLIEVFPQEAETSRLLHLHLKCHTLAEGAYFTGTCYDATSKRLAREWQTRSIHLYEALDAFVQTIENGSRSAQDLESALATLLSHLDASGSVLVTPTATVALAVPDALVAQVQALRTRLATLEDVYVDRRLRADHPDIATQLDQACDDHTTRRYVILPMGLHESESTMLLLYEANTIFSAPEKAAWHVIRCVLRRAIPVGNTLDTATQQRRDLTILYQVHNIAQESPSPTTLAEHLSPTLATLLGAQRVTIWQHVAHPTTPTFTCLSDKSKSASLSEEALTAIEAWLATSNTTVLQGHEIAPIRALCHPETRMVVLQSLYNGQLEGFLLFEFAHPVLWMPNDKLLFSTLGKTIGNILATYHLLHETEHRLRVLESVHDVSRALREATTPEELLSRLLNEVLSILRLDVGSIWLYNAEDEHMYPVAARGWLEMFAHTPIHPQGTIGGLALTHKQTIFSPEFATDPRTNPDLRDQVPRGWGGLCIPLRHEEHIAGVMYLVTPTTRHLSEEEILIAETLAEIGATALNRMRLHHETRQRLRQLETLRAIDRAITGSMDLTLILQVILDHLLQYTQGDAATVLLYNTDANLFEVGVEQGFHSRNIRSMLLHLSEGLAFQALRHQRPYFVEHLHDNPTFLKTSKTLLTQENFISGCFIPLFAKGNPKGVIELYFRRQTTLPADTLEFIDTIARQTALAIETAQLFENLQRSNVELALAYDATIEGWARALELRDEETEGHSQRVTEMTLLLARAMGIRGEALVHIRRGALLHDIGKMGIPDRILLKPGPLTNEEWEIMRQHPVLAYKLLSPIPFLRPALDIPYCHHEKWDGTGYPRGLKGEEIPLAARIFAVVDVWDALLSDRPYRKGWPPEKVYAFIQEQSGTHFDPKVVDVFLELWKPEMGHTVPSELPSEFIEPLIHSR
nr:HD domain-containing phosphohydrolase [Ardenticatena sp.]